MTAGIKANADGSAAIQVGGSDAITITSGLDTTFVGTVTSPTGTLYPLVRGTAVASTSGTSIDFTSIPSWVKRITVMFQGVSTSGTSNLRLQIGSTTFTTSGYLSSFGAINTASAGTGSDASGFALGGAASAASITSGAVILTNISANIWVISGSYKNSPSSVSFAGGDVSLSGTLDRVRITTVNGTDTFDAGSVNILWE
jgi:hypothetical protein